MKTLPQVIILSLAVCLNLFFVLYVKNNIEAFLELTSLEAVNILQKGSEVPAYSSNPKEIAAALYWIKNQDTPSSSLTDLIEPYLDNHSPVFGIYRGLYFEKSKKVSEIAQDLLSNFDRDE